MKQTTDHQEQSPEHELNGLENTALSAGSPGASMPPPPLDLQAGSGQGDSPLQMVSDPSAAPLQRQAATQGIVQRVGDPDGDARELHRIMGALQRGEGSVNDLTRVVEGIPDEEAEQVKTIYRQLYDSDLLEDLYDLLSGPYASHASALYGTTSWLINDSFSSDHAPGSDSQSNRRSSSDLLPGSDPYYASGGAGNHFIQLNIAGRYALVGEEVEIEHSDNTVVVSAVGSPLNLPYMEMAVVHSPSGAKSRFVTHGRGTRVQSFEYTPEEEGRHSIMAWIRHPDDHVEVMWQPFEAKSLRDVSREAHNEVTTSSFEEFRTQVELQEMGMSDFASQNQELGERYLSTSTANPFMGTRLSYASYQAHGFQETSRIQWYVRVQAANMPTQHYHGLDIAGSDAQSRYPTAPGERLYSAGQGPRARVPLGASGTFNVIAEERNSEGDRTGAVANYRHVVLSNDEAEQLNGFQDYQAQIDSSVETIAEGQEVPVQAAYTSEENSSSVAITMFIGPAADDPNEVVLIDMTPGVTRREYRGSTMEECIDDFNDVNTYPDGRITLTIPENEAGIRASTWTMETDGASFLQSLSSGTGWASLGFAAAGIVAAVVPGGQAFAPFLFMASAATGAVSGGLSLADRFREAEVSNTGVALDILTIASSILGGAAAFKAVRGGAAALQLTTGGRFLLYSSLAADGASALVMSVEGAGQIAALLDSDMPRGEKIGAIARIVANLAVTGGLFMLSVRDLNSARQGLAQRFGQDVVDALDDHALYSLAMLDDTQLTSLQRVPPNQISEFMGLISNDWPKGQRILALANFNDVDSFRAMFTQLELDDIVRLERVIGDPAYLDALSDSMRDRYTRIVRELGEDLNQGNINVEGIRSRIAVMEEVQSIRTSLSGALSEGANEAANLGSRNLAYGDYNVNLPNGGGGVSESYVSLSGRRSSDTVIDDLGSSSFGGRTVVPEVNRQHRVFQHTEGRAANDSERKLFEHILDRMEAGMAQATGQRRFRFDPNTSYAGQGYSGTINVYSEMLPCDSCSDIIRQQFSRMFGTDISVNIVHGVTYP